ncbi:MAG TPA: hypothetical protein VMU77_07515 [Acidimicrobiales bacterium]|nr:hypothetical protein [Acidimicrobiales bacterium]
MGDEQSSLIRVLDHIVVDVIAAIRSAFDDALLERQAIEERFQIDVFLGDLSWETSYSLPGEGSPPRVRADISLDWPTWSQSAYRSWSIGESPEDMPEVVIEIALRIQRLNGLIDPKLILLALNVSPPTIGSDPLEAMGPTIEQSFSKDVGQTDDPPRTAVEVSYEGTFHLTEEILTDPESLVKKFAPLGRWIASTLVRLGDLKLPFLPADEED